MENNKIVSLWTEARNLLREAENEIKDKVNFDPYIACMNCKKAIINFLNGYLMERHVIPSGIQNMFILLEQCKSIDAAFEEVDLSEINCRFEKINEDNCTDISNLEKCVEITNTIMNLTNLQVLD